MPNIRSAMKRMRSDRKKRARNQNVLSELKTLDHRMQKSAAEPAKAAETAKELVSRYDRAVSQGIVPRGRADRKKSRIAHFLQKIQKKK